MADRYEPASFEAKWRARWMEAELFLTREAAGAPKFYGLDFFPYPSGAGLSVGHCRNYVPTDVLCRMKAMQGYNVLHPMGFDAFGLPAENEAIKRHSHPAPMIERYANRYREQMDLVGISYDWSRSFKSSEPSYYKWTQWLFELMYREGLAYRKLAAVNWDPVDKTVLADEEVIAGRAERSGAWVEKKYIPQWFFKITAYAQALIDDLDTIDWPEGIKQQQRNWIGRSEGVEFSMTITFPEPVTPAETPIPPPPSRSSELEELEREIRESGFAAEIDPTTLDHIKRLEERTVQKAKEIDLFSTEQIEKVFQTIRGAESTLTVKQPSNPLRFSVFTTRIDTLFGMTFCVLAPEHPVVEEILKHVPEVCQQGILEYRLQARTLSDTDRQSTNREKTGVFTGAYAINPANGKKVPIWLADYVLATYGTGAIMAVPAHDQRDFEFAQKFGLEIVPVIRPTQEFLKQHFQPGRVGSEDFDEERELALYMSSAKEYPAVFDSKESSLINSGEYDSLTIKEAQLGLGLWIEGLGIGKRKIQYKLRDWLISRQRYWGCPIPIIHSKEGELQLAPLDSLPVELPWAENYEPASDGTSPLSRFPEFVNVTDLDGRLGQRETDTMGGFACSSWYFLRFCDPLNVGEAWNPDKAAYWMPVDTYVGGTEHAVMHLLYARFFTKVLYDKGLVKVKEPFQSLRNQGQVLAMTPYRRPEPEEKLEVGEEGIRISFEEAQSYPPEKVFHRWARMSKSKGNVVTPEEAVESSGADALRLYLLFKAPFEADIEWDNKGMDDLGRFLSRVFRLVDAVTPYYDPFWKDSIEFNAPTEDSKKIRRITHQTIRNVSADIERFAHNTYVSWLMKLVNELNPYVLKARGSEEERKRKETAEELALSEAVDSLILLLSPGAPHSADELWEATGHVGFTFNAPWPRFDAKLAAEDKLKIAVQVNGKLRETFEIDAEAVTEEYENQALALPKVQNAMEGKSVKKIIVVPKKLVNIVVS